MKSKHENFPFEIKVSFKTVIEAYKKRFETEQKPIAKEYLKNMLSYIASFPELESGIGSEEALKDHQEPIAILLDDIFPNILTNNEIKAAIVPQSNTILASSKRFNEIIKNAGRGYKLEVRNLNSEKDYVYGCIMILNSYYGYDIDFMRPFYYDIPDKDGIVQHYRLAMNADFVSFEPKGKAVNITEEDFDMLLANTENIDLWQEKFPPNSWVFKGFLIMNLTDVTIDDGISDLKTQLLSVPNKGKHSDDLLKIFRSIYKIPDLRIGFTLFDEEGSNLFKMEAKDNSNSFNSFILNEDAVFDCVSALNNCAFDIVVQNKEYFSISHVEKYAEENNYNFLSENLLRNDVKSCILAPIAKGNKLLAVLELVSYRKNELNSINAIKLDDIIPYIVTTLERALAELQNRIKAVIQSECTAIHPSVLWVFEEEAKKYINTYDKNGVASFSDISFDNVYPLYGQIDVVGSSEERNTAIQNDLLQQLKLIEQIFEKAYQLEVLPIYEQMLFRIQALREDIKNNLNASSEQRTTDFIHQEINPLIAHISKQSKDLETMINHYHNQVDQASGLLYNYRKHYDDAIADLNRDLARFLDKKQEEAQFIYPHYFERYKTDGVSHNMYIGNSMTRNKTFNKVYLYNLRLWQLQVMCEMENRFYRLQKGKASKLNAASLILAFNTTLTIRYRMDEKKFDVDGTYNARYEIIKKRIDKAFIKNTTERITQKGKLVVVYSQKADEKEYLQYIKYLQQKNYLGDKVELLELENLQGVVGLKAIRVPVLYHYQNTTEHSEKTVSYEDLMNVLH